VRRQIPELPGIKPVVIETQQHEVRCPHCQPLNRGTLPEGLEAERYFGPRLEGTVVYLKHRQPLSYERIVETLQFGSLLSEGGVAALIARAGPPAPSPASVIKQEVITSSVIKSDETSARVSGRHWGQWVFIGASAVYPRIAPHRTAEGIKDVMGPMVAEAWVCDCFSAQLKAPTKVFQLCLQLQWRDLQRVIDRRPRWTWAKAVQKLGREAIPLNPRFYCPQPELTLNGSRRCARELGNRLNALLEQKLSSQEARKLQARYTLHRDKLLTFLYYPDVPPTNNQSEQALRTSVIHRKVTNGFRSNWGAQTYADLQSVIATAKLKGQRVLKVLVNLMGTPVLQFLATSPP
jgi:transposase